MPAKKSKIIFKLYLSLQIAIFGIGGLLSVWFFIASANDVWVSQQAEDCVTRLIKKERLESVRQYPTQDWLSLTQRYLESSNHEAQFFPNLINTSCKRSVEVEVTRYSSGSAYADVDVKGWYSSYNTDLSDAVELVGASVGVTLGLMLFLFAIQQWFAWLAKD